MTPAIQVFLLEEALLERYATQLVYSRQILKEVAASIDNPDYVLPKWLKRHIKQEQRRYERNKWRYLGKAPACDNHA